METIMHENDPKLEDFVTSISKNTKARVERTAVFLCRNPDTVPQALMHNLKHNQVLHQTNVILTVVFAETPLVALDKRLETKEIGSGFWQVVVHFGFMENPDIPGSWWENGEMAR
jgi:KUP system potassium uptake protein